MIKVLDKTFGILELLAIASPEPLRPGRISEALNINTATCSRILKELKDSGYIEKAPRNAGYTVGPRAFTFSKQVSYNTELIEAADPIIEDCARKLQASIILVEFKQNKRFILLHHDFYPNSTICINQLSYTDIFETVTGALLLAYGTKEERENAVKTYGLPTTRIFAGVSTQSEYHDFLDEVKKQERVYYDKTAENTSIYAVPVLKNGKLAASLGATFIGGLAQNKNKKSILEEVDRTAENITKAISTINYIG